MIKVFGLIPFKTELKGLVRDIRVVWTLEEVGEKYEHVALDPLKREHKRPEYLALNPFGKVPTIQDGDFTLFESTAICTYLADKHDKLIPAPRTKERALFDQWIYFAVTTFEPPSFRVFGYDFFTKDKSPDGEKIKNDSLAIVESYLSVVDKRLEQQEYLYNSQFTLADIIFSSSCRVIAYTGVLNKYKHVSAYLEKNYSRPAFKTALARHEK